MKPNLFFLSIGLLFTGCMVDVGPGPYHPAYPSSRSGPLVPPSILDDSGHGDWGHGAWNYGGGWHR